MIDRGVPNELDVTDKSQVIFSFPQKSKPGSVKRDDMTAIDQLEHWKIWQDHWCEHKPSITVYVREHEWPGVGAWVWDHFDSMSGVSFLPHSDHVYKQAPYEEIDAQEYRRLVDEMPKLDWKNLSTYEQEDMTVGHRELACSAGVCEI